MSLGLHQKTFSSLESKRDETTRELTNQLDAEIRVTTDIAKIDSQIEEDRLLITQKEGEIAGIGQKILELENMIHRNEGRIEMLKEKIGAFNSQSERGAVEIEDIKREINQQKYQHSLAKAEREQFEALLKRRAPP